MQHTRTCITAFAALTFAWALSGCHADREPGIQVTDAVIPATPPNATSAAGYLTIVNSTAQDVRLTAAETAVAGTVTLHRSSIEDGIARMRPLAEGFLIRAGEHLSLDAAYGHLMLEGLKRPLTAGEQVPVTLTFAPGGKVEVTFATKSPTDISHAGSAHEH